MTENSGAAMRRASPAIQKSRIRRRQDVLHGLAQTAESIGGKSETVDMWEGMSSNRLITRISMNRKGWAQQSTAVGRVVF